MTPATKPCKCSGVLDKMWFIRAQANHTTQNQGFSDTDPSHPRLRVAESDQQLPTSERYRPEGGLKWSHGHDVNVELQGQRQCADKGEIQQERANQILDEVRNMKQLTWKQQVQAHSPI
ncbi:hypothetical protein WICPIJ_004583 [Wickerhamomyces pijperi]|uniref:Uncharacterized protein n=1 Tax=Wickerhamomyces pijperi TaxID=599730 RepID=A0A9P8Q7G5_WICPI|nr:hypothetical protein WICPIJ_004583 [Wickerhamomyces pijperi]